MTRFEWDKYGPDGPPDGWPDPVEVAQSLVDSLKGSDEAQRKQIRATVHKGLKCPPGRHKGTFRKLPPEAIPLWLAGLAPVSIRLKLHIPTVEDRAFKNRLSAAIKRLPDALRLAGKAAQQEARQMTRKKAASSGAAVY
jgi:hypothetical protein